MSGTERWLLSRHWEWATSRAAGDVLELAVGTGLNLPLYSERVLHVLGIDLSEAMPDQAQAGCAPAQHALNPLTFRCQADDLLRAPRPLVTDTGFETTEADQAGVAGLVHHVQARRPTSTTRSR